MRQLFLDKGMIAVHEVARPQLDEHSVLVSVHYSYISSGIEASAIANAQRTVLFGNVPHKIKTALSMFIPRSTHSKDIGSLQSLGFSCSGRVIAVGKKVVTFRAGDYVACAGAGFAHHADVVNIPEHLVVATKKENLKEAILTTLGAVALQATRKATIQLGETVCVLGLGVIGQLTVQIAKAAGCRVIGIDLLEERLETAKSLGADAVFSATSDTIETDIAFFTQHKGVDATLVTASGRSDTILKQAMRITRRKGKLVVVGDVGLRLEKELFFKKEIDLLVSCSYGMGQCDDACQLHTSEYSYESVRWTEKRNMQAVMDLLEQKKLNFSPFFASEFSVNNAADAYAVVNAKQSLGVSLSYRDKEEEVSFVPATKVSPLSFGKEIAFLPALSETVRVGIVGTGRSRGTDLFSVLSQSDHAKVTMVADKNIVEATQTSRFFGATKTVVDQQELFVDKDVDVVVFSEPEIFHMDLCIDALSQGKGVFVERPMITSKKELERAIKFFEHNVNVPFCVEYNRSFAPFIKKIKWEILDRVSPLMIQYRINSGHKKTEWDDAQSYTGKVISEASHIIDLFCFLVDSELQALSVESLKPHTDDLFPTDNFVLSMSFVDGSVCSLIYSSLGHAASGKERMELYFDGKSILMDDYRILKGFGTNHAFDETMVKPNKGHEALMQEFFEALKEKDRHRMPVSFNRFKKVSELTLLVDQLVCAGGGNREMRER